MAKKHPKMPRVIRIRVEFDTQDDNGTIRHLTPIDWVENPNTKLALSLFRSNNLNEEESTVLVRDREMTFELKVIKKESR